VVRLADAFRSAASEKVYRTTLVAVARAVAGNAEWPLDKIADTAEVAWIEDYIYQAIGFVHRPDRATLSDLDKAKERERAEQALQGKLPPPEQQTAASVAGVAAAVGVGFLLGLWALAPLAAIGVLGWLLGPSMKKVVPATLVLIHIRKRQEFERVLGVAA
jgi:hypothetical protein